MDMAGAAIGLPKSGGLQRSICLPKLLLRSDSGFDGVDLRAVVSKQLKHTNEHAVVTQTRFRQR